MLRRLLAFPAAVSGHLRRSLSTAASSSSHPPWAIIDYNTLVDDSPSSWAPGACFHPLQPPRVSRISAPPHLLRPRERPGPGSNVVQLLTGHVTAASADGHLLLTYYDILAEGTRASGWNHQTADMEAERFICNPVTGQLLRLPYVSGSRKRICYHRMGLLTQPGPGGAHGDARFAVADIVSQRERVIDRFLPELGRWDMVVGLPCQPTPQREMDMNQETVAFGGRLWWVDLTCGTISLDPFSYRPDLRFVHLPSGSTLTSQIHTKRCKDESAEEERDEVAKYRRVGVSEGRLRYVETSLHEPFLLTSYALDEEASTWTLEHQVELKQVLADGGHECNNRPPQIAVLDPMNAHVVYITLGEQEHVVAVDIYQHKVIGSAPLQNRYHYLLPCVLPPSLGASQFPETGKKGDMEAIDVLVSCGRHYKG